MTDYSPGAGLAVEEGRRQHERCAQREREARGKVACREVGKILC
jgi:hypothetical protein